MRLEDTVYCATCMTEPFLEGVRLAPDVGIVRSTCFGKLKEINIFDVDKAPPELHIVPNPNPNLPWGGALTGDTGGLATGRLERSMSLHPSSPSRGAHHHSPPRRKLLSRTKSLSRSLGISHPVRTPLVPSSSDSSRSAALGAAGGAFIAVPITLNNICMAVLCVDTLNRPAVLKSMTPRRLTKIHKVAEVLKRAFQTVESAIEKWEVEEARLKEDELPPNWSLVQEELSQLQLFQLKLERALQKPEVKMQLFEIDSYTHPPGKLLEMWLAVFGLVDMEGYGGPIVDWIRRLSITKLEDRKKVWAQLRKNIHNVSTSTGNKSILEYLLLAPMEDNPATGFVLKDAYRLADRLLRDMTKKDALRISRSAALLYDWVRTRQKLQNLLREIEREGEQGLNSSLTLKVIKAQAQELSKSLVQSLHHEPGKERRLPLTGSDPSELDDVAKEDLAKLEAELQQTPMEMRTKKEMQFYFGFNLWMLKSSSPFTFGHNRKRSQPRKTLEFSYPGPIGMRDISDAETSPIILSVHRKSARKPHSSSTAASSGKVSATAKSWSKVAKFAKSGMTGPKTRTSRSLDHPPLNASFD
ncbi:hypothetical protein CYMTET_4481 [Cymbomonas tetramitiformis]|uniref:Uncharacterized protein n=1 Tax=Cymbomonas tetramitiformis TaxID=36881 RepID=A0AAE0H134_9CHLO|nr:hypothetical protein CYMTET_4481 [Cymbomonas tetramitiformis]